MVTSTFLLMVTNTQANKRSMAAFPKAAPDGCSGNWCQVSASLNVTSAINLSDGMEDGFFVLQTKQQLLVKIKMAHKTNIHSRNTGSDMGHKSGCTHVNLPSVSPD